METNKEIPTAEEFRFNNGNSDVKASSYMRKSFYSAQETERLMIEFAKLCLSKQAEVIAENVDMKYEKQDGEYQYIVDKQSILQASEEYIKNVK